MSTERLACTVLAVLPSMAYWNQVKGDQTCKVGDVMINVGGIKSGKDASGRNIVNQIVFLSDRDKIYFKEHVRTENS